MKIAGLYAGIGGFELGFQAIGATATLLADKDDACRLVLEKQFPDAIVVGDVAEIEDIPSAVDVLTAGFPCQNLSMAGDKTGLQGSKTGDVMGMFGLLRRRKIPTIVLENVYFLLSVDRGRAMSRLVALVEELGYAWAYRVVDLRSFGTPQRRRRVVFVASTEFDPSGVLFSDDEGAPPNGAVSIDRPLGFYWTEGRSGVGLVADGIPPIKGGSAVGIPSPPAVLLPDGRVMTPSIEACEQLQGFPCGWTEADYQDRRSPRWKMLGNAMPVPIAEWAAQCIAKNHANIQIKANGDLRSDNWPLAAFGNRKGRSGVTISEYPVLRVARGIEAYLDEHWKPLSRRALDGFIGRAETSNLRFPPGFLDALRKARAQAS
jgi:DNA (cytosine-5)-methyltransferase 1